MRKKIIKAIALVLCMSFIIPALSVKAAPQKEILQSKLYTLTQNLKYVLSEKREEVVREINKEILKNDWDYDLTMKSVESDKIFKDMDYIQLLSAYMTAKEYYEDHGRGDFKLLKDIPLITYTLTPKTVTEEIPEKRWEYRKIKEGVYVKDKEVYVLESGYKPTYEKQEDGYYDYIGDYKVILKKQDVTYAEASFHVMDATELLDFYGVDEETQDKVLNQRVKKLSVNTGNEQIYQSMFSRAPMKQTPVKSEEESRNYKNSSDIRKDLIKVAKTLIGQVPYEWGGKATKAGYDTSWWLFDENSVQQGLDCSGYVQWVYMTMGFKPEIYNQLLSTTEILNSSLPEIEKSQLQIGDIGVRKGLITNHTGIYYGNIGGKDMWIHCSGSADTVIVSEFEFQKFYSPISLVEDKFDENISQNEEKTYIFLDKSTNSLNLLDEFAVWEYYTDTENFTEEEVYLLAQLMVHEAGGEGINGWVAVAEVVKNRLDSHLFPDTMQEVIYQSGQFSYVEKISSIVPSDEIIRVARAVLNGQMSILNNSDCMYYKNPQITDNISVNERVNWGPFKYYMPIGNHAFYLQN